MRFFDIFIGVCSGTAIFPGLVHVPVFKAIKHLLLLALLSALFIAGMISFSLHREIASICRILADNCESLNITPNGLVAGKNPQKSRVFLVSDGISLNYHPGPVAALTGPGELNAGKGIIWTSGMIAGWMKIEDRYLLIPLVYPSGKISIPTSSMTPDGIKKFIAEKGDAHGPFNLSEPVLKFAQLPLLVLFYAAAILFLSYFFQIVFNTLLFNAVFALIFGYIGNRNLKNLKFSNFFAAGIYAAFPAIVISSFFPAFDLPYVDHQTAFLFVFVGYLMFAFNRLEKSAAKNQPDEIDFDE